mgnify:CR=1 FL=1
MGNVRQRLPYEVLGGVVSSRKTGPEKEGQYRYYRDADFFGVLGHDVRRVFLLLRDSSCEFRWVASRRDAGTANRLTEHQYLGANRK